MCAGYKLRADWKWAPSYKRSKLRRTGQARTAKGKDICETGVGGTFEYLLDCSGDAEHGNEQSERRNYVELSWGLCICRVKYAFFCLFYYFAFFNIFLCIELNFKIAKTRWRYCNIWGKRREGETVGDRGMVTKDDGMLFVRNLG